MCHGVIMLSAQTCINHTHHAYLSPNILFQQEQFIIEEYSAKRGLNPIWFISRKMAKQDFVYHCWQWLAVTLKWPLHMLWISHHYETFTECRNEDSVAEIDTNSIFMIWGLKPLLALYSSIILTIKMNQLLYALRLTSILYSKRMLLPKQLPNWYNSKMRWREEISGPYVTARHSPTYFSTLLQTHVITQAVAQLTQQ